jgi:hypothetical protein
MSAMPQSASARFARNPNLNLIKLAEQVCAGDASAPGAARRSDWSRQFGLLQL